MSLPICILSFIHPLDESLAPGGSRWGFHSTAFFLDFMLPHAKENQEPEEAGRNKSAAPSLQTSVTVTTLVDIVHV